MLVSPIPESLTVVLVADARDHLDVAVRLIARRLADKREAAPIRRPRQGRRVIGGRYEQPCLAAVGQEGDPPAIWRPSRKGVTVLSGRELPQGTAIHRRAPQV